MRQIPFRIVLLVLFGLAWAQEKKALTNEDVVKMVKAGLPESTIALAIQQSEPRFDTSASGLVGLKERGVPPSVMEAMIRAGQTKTSGGSQSSTVLEAGSRAPGLYVQQGSDWIRLAPLDFQRSARMKSAGGDFGSSTWVLPTPKAEVQLRSARPVFHFVENPDAVREREKNPFASEQQLPAIQIVQMTPKGGGREFQIGGRAAGILNGRGVGRMSFKSESLRPVQTKRVRPDTILIQTATELAHGEYLLAFDNPSGLGTFLIDFGVDSEVVGTSSAATGGFGTVYVYRESGAFKPSVLVDGDEWLRLPANRRATLKLPPGTYVFQADNITRRQTTLTVEAGKTYYLKYHVSFTNVWFDVIDAARGEPEFQKASPVDAEWIKNKESVIAQ